MLRSIPLPRLCGAAFAVASLGCASAPTAQLGVEAPAAARPKGEVEAYTLDGASVSLEADVSAGSSYTIQFPTISGTLSLTPEVPEASSFVVSVETSSATASWQLVADIAKDQFLHTGTYPRATLTSSALRKEPDGKVTMFATLDFHGTQQTLAAPATLTVVKCEATFFTEFAIDRRKFGAISDGGLDGVVSDNVVVRVKGKVAREAPGCAAPAKPTTPEG